MIDVYAQHECKRCEKLFCYFRIAEARRFYCTPCVALERRDLLDFTKMQRRMAAISRAHEQSSARHFSRFPEGGLCLT